MLDYHLHSQFSADCQTPMETTIKTAIENGFQEICFTDHIDYDYPDESIEFDFDLNKYDEAIKQLQAEYRDQIHIKKGVEIGVQPHVLDRYERLMNDESFDFVICSMHTTAYKDLHSKALFEDKTVEEAQEIYYQELLACVKQFKRYNVLGHIDLIKRYCDRPSEISFHPIISEIFKEIIGDGKGIELNTSGKRYGLEHGLPSPDILQLYKECGGEIITLGSDSHSETTLGYDFQSSLKLLKEIGFRYITSFHNGEPRFHSIDKQMK